MFFAVLLCSLWCRTGVLPQTKSSAAGKISDYKLFAPDIISVSSCVIDACLALLYSRLRFSIISDALSVADSIAFLRADNSDATYSDTAPYTIPQI